MRKHCLTCILCLTLALSSGCEKAELKENDTGTAAVSDIHSTMESDSKTEFVAGQNAVIDWDALISDAILMENQGKYSGEECRAEGHKILGMEENGNEITLWVLTMYGEYQFQDGNFVKEAGSGVIPAVLVFAGDGKGSYSLKSYEEPMDGGEYQKSIHELFPENLWGACTSFSDETIDLLKNQERVYASEYLNSLGREAVIGEYRDFEHPLLTESGVSVEVSNKLAEDKNITGYPFWIGCVERLRDGVRYIYKMELKQEEQKIILTKTAADSGVVAESYVFDSITGELLFSD